MRVELEDGVEVHYLDSGDGVELLAGDDFKDLLRDSVGVRIPVSPWHSDDSAVLADVAEIHAPGVDTDRFDLHAHSGDLFQSRFEVVEEGIDVPVIFSVYFSLFYR